MPRSVPPGHSSATPCPMSRSSALSPPCASPPRHAVVQQGWRRVLDGFVLARRDRVVGRCLSTMVLFSFFCLPIAVLMPVLAHNDLRIEHEYHRLRSAVCQFRHRSCRRRPLDRHLPRRPAARAHRPRRPRWLCGGTGCVRPVAQPRARLPRRVRPRSVLLRHGHVAGHRAPEAARRLGARPGDGPVGHGLRRHRSTRRHRGRTAQRAVRHLGRGAGRSRRGGGAGLPRQISATPDPRGVPQGRSPRSGEAWPCAGAEEP